MATERVSELLDLLQDGLINANCWQDEMPSQHALNSKQPFCVDTLSFEQWLQFILIPRLRLMIAQHQPLPSNVKIAPMAEHVLSNRTDGAKIITLIASLDKELQS